MNTELLYDIYLSHPIVSTDTRNITKGCLFFSLKGEHFNGNQFAKNALENGAAYAIIDEEKYCISEQYILVEDVLTCLQQLAHHHRKQFNIPFVGITGTNGKTTTKEFINVILSKQYKTTFTQGNLNNHIGVPLTLLSIPRNCEIAIIEMGANHIGEIEFLCKIAEPNYGIITNIGTAHIEGFGSKEGVLQTKNELYQFIQSVHGKVFVNGDDETLTTLSKSIDKITYGNSNANCNATLLAATPAVKIDWNSHLITSNLYGSYNFYNILAAICIGNYFNVAHEKIKAAIEEYFPTNNRSQIVTIGSNTIFLDAYNANPTSMNAAIDTFAQNESPRKLMVLGDMLELGAISQAEHQKIVDKVNALNIDALFIGNEFNTVANKHHFTYLNDVTASIDWLKHAGLIDYNILIKGSRGIKLEGITQHL